MPGINPERADIIVSGAAVLDAVMTGVGAESIRASDRALRDGLLIDHLFQEGLASAEYLSGSVPAKKCAAALQSVWLCRTTRGQGRGALPVYIRPAQVFRDAHVRRA